MMRSVEGARTIFPGAGGALDWDGVRAPPPTSCFRIKKRPGGGLVVLEVDARLPLLFDVKFRTLPTAALLRVRGVSIGLVDSN